MSQISYEPSLAYTGYYQEQPQTVPDYSPPAGIRGPLLAMLVLCVCLVSYWQDVSLGPWLSAFSQVIVCILGIVVIGSVVAQGIPIVFTLECVVICGFFAWALIGYPMAILPSKALESLGTFLKLLLVALATANAINGRRAFLWLLTAIIVAAVVGSVCGVTGIARGAEMQTGTGEVRVAGIFGNANGLAKLMCIAIWAATSILLASKRPVVRLAMIGAIVFSVVIVGLSGSRQGFASLFLMIVATYWFVLRKTSTRASTKMVWLILIGLILGGVGLYMTTTAHWRRVTVVLEKGVKGEGSLAARSSFMNISFRTIGKHPVFGVGYDCVAFVIGGYRLTSPHNTIMGVAANTGIPGWLLFFGGWGVLLWRTHRVSLLPLPPTDRVLVLCMWLVQGSLLLWSSATTLLNFKPFFAVTGAALGYLVWLERTYGGDRPAIAQTQ